MTRLPVAVRPQAEAEATRAAQWYENESQGLGVAFLEVLEHALATLSENPERYPIVHRDVRRALLKRFPYGVFFRVRPGHIRVIAVIHLARDPLLWQRR